MKKLILPLLVVLAILTSLLPEAAYGWKFRKNYTGKSVIKVTNCGPGYEFFNGRWKPKTKVKIRNQWGNKFMGEWKSYKKSNDGSSVLDISCSIRGTKKKRGRFRGKMTCTYAGFGATKKATFTGKLKRNKLYINRVKLRPCSNCVTTCRADISKHKLRKR